MFILILSDLICIRQTKINKQIDAIKFSLKFDQKASSEMLLDRDFPFI